MKVINFNSIEHNESFKNNTEIFIKSIDKSIECFKNSSFYGFVLSYNFNFSSISLFIFIHTSLKNYKQVFPNS